MRGLIRTRLGSRSEDQQGFTLIELLVVIGIIVALAAVMVPMIIQFSGEGAEAAENREWDTVQTLIDLMMADNEMTSVTPSGGVTRISDTFDWNSGAGTQALATYTRDTFTGFCYTWTGNGSLTAQYKLNEDLTCSAIQTNP